MYMACGSRPHSLTWKVGNIRRPVFVTIISVPCSWNLSHNCFVSNITIAWASAGWLDVDWKYLSLNELGFVNIIVWVRENVVPLSDHISLDYVYDGCCLWHRFPIRSHWLNFLYRMAIWYFDRHGLMACRTGDLSQLFANMLCRDKGVEEEEERRKLKLKIKMFGETT